jgi:hypothetical protein
MVVVDGAAAEDEEEEEEELPKEGLLMPVEWCIGIGQSRRQLAGCHNAWYLALGRWKSPDVRTSVCDLLGDRV